MALGSLKIVLVWNSATTTIIPLSFSVVCEALFWWEILARTLGFWCMPHFWQPFAFGIAGARGSPWSNFEFSSRTCPHRNRCCLCPSHAHLNCRYIRGDVDFGSHFPRRSNGHWSSVEGLCVLCILETKLVYVWRRPPPKWKSSVSLDEYACSESEFLTFRRIYSFWQLFWLHTHFDHFPCKQFLYYSVD